jgi:hypothetical protein
VIATLAAVVFATAAVAAPSAVFLKVTPSTVYRGHVVTVRGNAGSCPVGDTMTIISRAFPHTHDFAGVPALFAKVKTGGAFSASTRIPAKRKPGKYGITARCGGGNLGVSARLTVRA